MTITKIHGNSMAPTLHDGQFIHLDQYHGQPLAIGDLVAFMHPRTNHASIKRVIALPGQSIAIHRGLVHVDGQPLHQTPRSLISAWEAHGMRSWPILPMHGESMAEVIVPDGHVFVMGDNRAGSLDGRHYGCVSLSTVVGVISCNHNEHGKDWNLSEAL